MELRTERLRLVPLSAGQLSLCLEHPERLEAELRLRLSRDVLTERVERAIRMKLAKMAAVNESLHPWYTYWLLVIPTLGFGAGLAGFKGCPDARGEVEIGYGIDPAVRGRGYMTEAARALIAWVFQNSDCRAVVAIDTMKWNIASQRVLAKVGMTIYQESDDAQCWRIDRESP